MDVCRLVNELNNLTAETWHKIGVGPGRGLGFGEESITDHDLFELDRRGPGVEVYKFRHPEETLNGADFDWYVGSAAGGWVGMRFQAEKLSNGLYNGLSYQVQGQKQFDLLERSDSDNMWPF